MARTLFVAKLPSLANWPPAVNLLFCNEIAFLGKFSVQGELAFLGKVALPRKILGKFTLHSEVCLDGDTFRALGGHLEGHPLGGSVICTLVSVMIGISSPAGCCRCDPFCVALLWLTWEMNISSISGLTLLCDVTVLGKDAILGEVTLRGKVAFSAKLPSLANLPSAATLPFWVKSTS